MIDLKEVIEKYPESLDNAGKLRAYLIDLYPEERAIANIIVAIFECGIAEEIKRGESDQLALAAYAARLEKNYGFSQELSRECLKSWMEVYTVTKLHRQSLPVVGGGKYSETIAMPTRTLTLFILIDTSDSMRGEKIALVNYAMKEISKIIKETSDAAPNANIEVAAATFGNGVNWISPKPQSPDEFINTWHDVRAGGLSSIGAALNELNQKMSRSEFLGQNYFGYLNPGVIILSNGNPTDSWQSALRTIKENYWFRDAIKVAFAVGDDANKQVLTDICGSTKKVVAIENYESIENFIKFVTHSFRS